MLSKEEYQDYCNKYAKIYKYLVNCSYEKYSVLVNICQLREYDLESNMFSTLNEAGFIFIDPDNFDESLIQKFKWSADLGLLNSEGKFLLNGRFIFPVKDMLGNIIALIGWYPDEKKYITTPSKFFSKECLFYGMEQLNKTGLGKNYFITEGIFDSLSIRSLGFNCVAMMGITSSMYKQVMYGLFKRVIAIPDADGEGRDVIKYDKWKLPKESSYFRWSGFKGIKDIDDLCKNYDMKDTLKELWKEKDRVIELR